MTRSSTASMRSSSSLALSAAANGSSANSASAGPRQSSSASRSVAAARGIAVGEQLAPLPEQPLEPQRVDLAGVDFEHVAGWPGRQRGRAPGRGERLPQLRDPHPQRGAAARRRLAAPDLVEQAVLGDDLARVEQQAGEQRALPRPRSGSRRPRSSTSSGPRMRKSMLRLLTLAPVGPR